MAAPLALAVLRPAAAALVTLAVAATFLAAAQIAFDHGRIVAVAAPLTGLVLGGAGAAAALAATEGRERRRLRTLFARFVPASVVDEVVDRLGGEPRLGGERRDATVLFADLRGFTTFAESLDAERVIEVLNNYLGEMSDAILGHGGTLVAYMGDGIMAVFGAPLPQDDHADRALAAAREMAGPRLDAVNAWLAAHGLPEPFGMGIGLCSGPVMSGNVGSAQRLEYTAIGDTTNTAARLEAMTKERGCTILLADGTRERLRAPGDDLRPLGEVAVRGRRAHLRIWTIGEVSATAPDGGRSVGPSGDRAPTPMSQSTPATLPAAPSGPDGGPA
jgi:adenylate cyclase